MTSSAPLEAAKTKRVEAGILLSFRHLMYDASKQVGELVLAKRFLRISLFLLIQKVAGDCHLESVN
jgi:hypothetical protein